MRNANLSGRDYNYIPLGLHRAEESVAMITRTASNEPCLSWCWMLQCLEVQGRMRSWTGLAANWLQLSRLPLCRVSGKLQLERLLRAQPSIKLDDCSRLPQLDHSRIPQTSSFSTHRSSFFTNTKLHTAAMFSTRALPRALNGARAFSSSPAHSLARMQLIGRLADQPELTPTSTGREMVRYALGVSTGAKDESGQRPTSWFRVASFTEGPGRDVLLGLPKG